MRLRAQEHQDLAGALPGTEPVSKNLHQWSFVYVQVAFQGRPHKQAEIKARPRPVKRQPLDDDVKAPGRLQTGENWLPRHGRREDDTPCVRMTTAPNLMYHKVFVAIGLLKFVEMRVNHISAHL